VKPNERKGNGPIVKKLKEEKRCAGTVWNVSTVRDETSRGVGSVTHHKVKKLKGETASKSPKLSKTKRKGKTLIQVWVSVKKQKGESSPEGGTKEKVKKKRWWTLGGDEGAKRRGKQEGRRRVGGRKPGHRRKN